MVTRRDRVLQRGSFRLIGPGGGRLGYQMNHLVAPDRELPALALQGERQPAVVRARQAPVEDDVDHVVERVDTVRRAVSPRTAA